MYSFYMMYARIVTSMPGSTRHSKSWNDSSRSEQNNRDVWGKRAKKPKTVAFPIHGEQKDPESRSTLALSLGVSLGSSILWYMLMDEDPPNIKAIAQVSQVGFSTNHSFPTKLHTRGIIVASFLVLSQAMGKRGATPAGFGEYLIWFEWW